MRRPLALAIFLVVAPLVVAVAPAAAWDPDETDPSDAPFEPPPFALPVVEPIAVPEGIYRVTDAYAGDYVSRDGPVTTYGTATVHGPTDSYARVIDTVATGADSAFDGAAFNGRSALTDGRPVAGTYYENFFLTDAGFVSFGIVFFQDDAETARSAAPAVPQPPVPPGPVLPPDAPASGPSAPSAPSGPSAPPPAVPVTVVVPPSAPVGAVDPGTEPPAPRTVDGPPAIDPVAEPRLGARVEVLRGRRVEIWLRGLPAGAAWRFVGGDAVVLGPRAGGAGDPFVARWDRLAVPGGTWTLRFEIIVAAAPTRALSIEVAVRSPGLVE